MQLPSIVSSLLLLPLVFAAPAPVTGTLETPFTLFISAPSIAQQPLHLYDDLKSVLAPSGHLQQFVLKNQVLQFQHPISNLIYAAYLDPSSAVTFARSPMNMLKTIARKVSPCLSALKLDLVDATKEWCALQDRGGAYGLKVVNKGVDNGACVAVSVMIDR